MKQWYESLFENYAQKYDKESFVQGTLGECDFIEREIKGDKSLKIIDIGCGTGFWMPYYAKNCSEITLVDQSRSMLVQCQKRVNELESDVRIHLLKGNFFEIRFFSKIFDTTLIAFLISHLDEEHEQLFFKKLKRILKPRAEMLWIDGSWSRKRARYRQKEGFQERLLNDGSEFSIFKRYFEKSDVHNLLKRYSLALHSLYMGDIFFAAHAISKH